MAIKKRIMIVDDEPTFLEQFEEMLRGSGYKTAVYSDGTTALAAIRAQKPDLVLLDLKMNGKSGFLVAQILHNDPVTVEIPVIVMSAFYGNHHFERLIKEYGVRRCLSKPLRPFDVITEIESILGETS